MTKPVVPPCQRVFRIDTCGQGRTVEDPRERDEFDRIKLHQDIERARAMITQYETGVAHFRRKIETCSYTLGQLDERLGGGS